MTSSKTRLCCLPRDFADLRKNNTLEILSGDKVTIRYMDDRYVTKGKQRHERFLNVSFSDGRIDFADIEHFSSRHRKKMPYYERLLRFQHGKPFPVVIRDADMDIAVDRDAVRWKAVDGEVSSEIRRTGNRTFDRDFLRLPRRRRKEMKFMFPWVARSKPCIWIQKMPVRNSR